jgi:hypothetical protein
MQIRDIIAGIDAEIDRLQQAKAVLANAASDGYSTRTTRSSSSASPKKRTLSPEARSRIAAAQKARWAKVKRATK